MSEKTNKELAVEVAIEVIKANPRMTYKQTHDIANSISLEGIVNVIQGVYTTLENLDEKQ